MTHRGTAWLRPGTARGDLGVTFGGRLVQLGLAFAGNVLAARVLGPAEFGRFGLVIAVVMIAGTVADAGLTFATVRFVARFRDGDPVQARSAAAAYFWLRAGSASVLTALGIVLAKPLAVGLLDQPSLEPYLGLAMLTLLALWLSSYPGAVLSGLSLFGQLALAGLMNALITVSGILLLSVTGTLNLGTLVTWNIVLPVLSSVPAWLLMPADWRPWRLRAVAGDIRTAGRELVRFGRWTAASTFGAILGGQIDLLLMGRLADPASTGTYSVAVTLAGRLDIVNQSLFTIMMPRASRLTEHSDRLAYTQTVGRASLILAGGLAGAALLAQPFILLFYGTEYALSVPVFLILLPVVLIDLVTTSVMLVTFSTNQARLMAGAEWLRAATVAGIAVSVIPSLGGIGAALARLVSRLVGAAYTLWALRSRVLTNHSAGGIPGEDMPPPGPAPSGVA